MLFNMQYFACGFDCHWCPGFSCVIERIPRLLQPLSLPHNLSGGPGRGWSVTASGLGREDAWPARIIKVGTLDGGLH